jgi:hypothetical protein
MLTNTTDVFRKTMNFDVWQMVDPIKVGVGLSGTIASHKTLTLVVGMTMISWEATHRFRTSNNAKSNPEIKGRNSIFFRHDALQVSGHALFTSTPHVFLLNIFINKTERSIHFY